MIWLAVIVGILAVGAVLVLRNAMVHDKIRKLPAKEQARRMQKARQK